MFKRLSSACVGVAAIVVAAGCAAPKIETAQLVPARNQEASSLKRVAVLPFTPFNGADVTGDVETLLAGIVINDSRYFDVVERQRLSALLAEMRLASTGVIDDSTASRLGKMLAANGVYLGRVSRNDWSDQRVAERRQICTQYEQRRDRQGNLFNAGCLRWQETTAQCTIRTAFFEFAPKLVSVESGAIVYARDHAGEVQAKACSEPGAGGSQPLSDPRTLLAEARRKALDSFRLDVAPSTQARSIVVLDSADRIAAPAAKERFKAAVTFAGGRRLDRACEIWQELAATESNSPELAYNLGLCAETSGDMGRALELYTAADRQLNAPNSTITSALERVRKDSQDRSRLERQLRPEAGRQAPTAPPADAAPAQVVAPAGLAPAPVALPPPSPDTPPTRDMIARAQARLNALGFNAGPPDGMPGARTRQAVRQFQEARGLQADGQLNSQTLRALGI